MKESQGNSVREAWLLCLILGLIMINFPFIHIFNTEQLLLGIPNLVVYFFIGWPISIAVIWFFTSCLDNQKQIAPEKNQDKSEP